MRSRSISAVMATLQKPSDGYELRDFANDVGAFMDAVGLDAAVLAGASSGGYVAQRFVVDSPARTLGLALIGSPRSLRGPRPPFADVLARLDDPIDAAFARELSEGMVALEVPNVVMATLCEENLKAPARVWRDAFEGLLAADPPLDTGRISAPTLIVWGARDSLLPRGDQEAMATEIPDARSWFIPRSATCRQSRRPSASPPTSQRFASSSPGGRWQRGLLSAPAYPGECERQRPPERRARTSSIAGACEASAEAPASG
jgi:pimeloyl-ACP methyl ester carboxylesterase